MRKIISFGCVVFVCLCGSTALYADSKTKIPDINALKKVAPAPTIKNAPNTLLKKTPTSIPSPKIKPAVPITKIPSSKLPNKKVKVPVRTRPTVSTDRKAPKIPAKQLKVPVRKPPAGVNTAKIPSHQSIQALKKNKATTQGQANLSRSIQSLGSAGKDIGRRNDFGVKLPGHNVLAGGTASSTNNSVGGGKLGNTNGVSSATSGVKQPVQMIGRGITRQSNNEVPVYGPEHNKKSDYIVLGAVYVGKNGYITVVDTNTGEETPTSYKNVEDIPDDVFGSLIGENLGYQTSESSTGDTGTIYTNDDYEETDPADPDGIWVVDNGDGTYTPTEPGDVEDRPAVSSEDYEETDGDDPDGFWAVDNGDGTYTPISEEEAIAGVGDDENTDDTTDATADTGNCKDGEEGCGAAPDTSDDTTVAEDEPDGEGATAGDVTLTGNGNDTTGGVNDGGEQEVAGGGAVRQVAGRGSAVSDLPGRIKINAADLNSLNVIIDATGGIRQE